MFGGMRNAHHFHTQNGMLGEQMRNNKIQLTK